MRRVLTVIIAFLAVSCAEDEPIVSQPQVVAVPRNTDFEICATQGYQAESTDVDIIVVLENSNLALDFAGRVQENLDAFGALWGPKRARVVLLSFESYPATFTNLSSSVYVPVNTFVDEGNGLLRLKNDFERYSASLRPNATTHILAITATDSIIPWEEFSEDMEALLGHDYFFHAVASPEKGCVASKEPGAEYLSLASERGGLSVSLCNTDWSSIGTQIADSIPDPVTLPCLITPADPPEGKDLDYRKAAMLFTNGNGEEFELPNVGSAAGCSETADGWYFDNALNPGTIQLCSGTCPKVSDDLQGVLGIAYGCTTAVF